MKVMDIMWKKILILIVALFVTAVIGYILPFQLSEQSIGVRVNKEGLQEQFNKEIEMIYENRISDQYEQEWNQYVRENPKIVTAFINKVNGIVQEEEITAMESTTDGAIPNQNTKANEFDFFDDIEIPYGTEDNPISVNTIKELWLRQKIEENREAVGESDLATGLELYEKLDTNFLFEKANDGLTVDEVDEVYSYLKENLTYEEYSAVLELYNKYIGLLQ